MKKITRSLILATGVAIPIVSSPMMFLTSCSTVWGYNTPIQFGSAIASDSSNPFVKFQTKEYLDGNGRNIVPYLQSSYIIDAKNSAYYAYSNPVTKWTYTDKEVEEKSITDSQIMPGNEWQHKASGWKTSAASEYSSNYSFTGTKLDNDKYKTVINNENVIQAANTDFTGSIASTIAGYFTGALKFQASQVNPSDKGKNINIAWGSEANFLTNNYTLYHGKKEEEAQKGSDADKINNMFYEYAFAQANGHVTSKNNHGAFLRTTNVGFNFDENYFPIPSYYFEGGNKVDISEATKKLLMGSNAEQDSKWCELGTKSDSLPIYYSSKTDGTNNMSLGYDKSAKKQVAFNLKYTNYTFNAVPVLITVNDLTQRWVNPTINNSIHINDFYVNDQTTVQNITGTFTNIGTYANHESKKAEIREYKFKPSYVPAGQTKVQVEVQPTKVGETEGCRDTRIAEKLPGNTFVALITYGVAEFDNNNFVYINGDKSQGYTEYVTNLQKELVKVNSNIDTEEKTVAYLRSLNSVTLSDTSSIFPAYFMNIYKDLFKQAYTPGKGETVAKHGYILDLSKISSHVSALLNIFNRESGQGYSPTASALNQDSKNLLTFLMFMFKNTPTTEDNLIHFEDAVDITDFKA